MIGADECKSMVPLMNTRGVLGAIYDPLHGHVDAASVTQSMAAVALEKAPFDADDARLRA